MKTRLPYIILLLSFGMMNLVSFPMKSFGQISSSDPVSSLSEYLGLDISQGGALDQGTTPFNSFAGAGIWNYINLGILDSESRKGFYGIGIPARAWITVQNRAPSEISSMYSLATQFRLNCQLHPVHESWWLFLATGPEYRWIQAPEKNLNLMMMQIEIGLKRMKKSALISNFELGITTSHMFKDHGLDIRGFGSIFMRLYLFSSIMN